MTTKEFNRKLDEQLKKIEDAKFLLTCVSEVHSRQVKRIFEKGLTGDGVKIGSYNSTNPLYVDPDKSPKKFPTTGKTGSDTFKDGRKHKTGYFDSYKAFRQAIGREINFVNLRLTENLKFDFTNSLTLNGRVYQTGVNRKENSDKVSGIASKYGVRTWGLMQSEIDLYKQCIKTKLLDTLNN